MSFNPAKHKRRSIRLKGYDYTQPGSYFITICSKNRENIFGDIIQHKMVLNETGELIKQEWMLTSAIRPNIIIDEFVIMPNHLHGILTIQCRDMKLHIPTLEKFGKPTSNSIATIIRSFKATTTKKINERSQRFGTSIWQKNYYERVIRNETELIKIRTYINENPEMWEQDNDNPKYIKLS